MFGTISQCSSLGSALDVLREVPQHEVEGEEDRDLDEHRQARRRRVDLVLLVELHQLLVQALAVALVLRLDRLHLRHVRLHALHRVDLLDHDRHERDPDDDRQRDDRPAPREADRVVQVLEQPRERVLDRAEDPGDDHASPGSRRRRGSRGCSAAAASRLQRPAHEAELAVGERRVLRAGRVVLAGRRAGDAGRGEERAERRGSDASCGRLPEHLVEPLPSQAASWLCSASPSAGRAIRT